MGMRGCRARRSLTVLMAAGGLIALGHVEGGMAIDAFARYQGKTPELPVSFEYPAGWQVEESSGSQEVYRQVQIYGPKSLEDRLRVYLVVRAVPPKAVGGRYEGLEDMVRQYRVTLMSSLHVDAQGAIRLLGSSVPQLEVSGTLPRSWWSVDPEQIPVKGQRVFLEQDGRFYELGWMATAEASGPVAEAFRRLLQTLTLAQATP